MAKPEKSTARPPRQADAPAPKRKRGRPPASAEISRDRILEAALAEFAERGFDGATTAAVARGSGVTQPLVHYYFGTKEGLWRAAMEHLGHRLTNVLSAAEEDAEGLTAVEAIRMYMRRLVYFCASNPEFSACIVQEIGRDSPRTQWVLERYFQPLAGQYDALIERGQRDGSIRSVNRTHGFFAFLGGIFVYFAGAAIGTGVFGENAFDRDNFEEYAESVGEILVMGGAAAKSPQPRGGRPCAAPRATSRLPLSASRSNHPALLVGARMPWNPVRATVVRRCRQENKG